MFYFFYIICLIRRSLFQIVGLLFSEASESEVWIQKSFFVLNVPLEELTHI
jgi:hypothetical protein